MSRIRRPSAPVAQKETYSRYNLPLDFVIANYVRQSQAGQRSEHQEGAGMQEDDMRQRALEMGWDESKMKTYVENERDGRIVSASGRLPLEKRPALSAIITGIKADEIKAVIVSAVDRLFRDEDLNDAPTFVSICKEHNCLVITKRRVFDFVNNPDDGSDFRGKAEDGGQAWREQVMERLVAAKNRKSSRGDWDGGRMPTGYRLEGVGRHAKKFVIEPLHAPIILWLYTRLYELGGDYAALWREVKARPFLFPLLPGGEQANRHIKLKRVPGGFTISQLGLKDLLCNPVYIGTFARKAGENAPPVWIENNHEAIVPRELFDFAESAMLARTERRKAQQQEREQAPRATRARHSRVGMEEKTALLEGLIQGRIYNASGVSSLVPVYVFRQWSGDAYRIIDARSQSYGAYASLGGVQCAQVDALFEAHLLQKMREVIGSDRHGRSIARFMHETIAAITRKQLESTSILDDKIAEFQKEVTSKNRVLEFSADLLTPEKVRDFAARVTLLDKEIARLIKQRETMLASNSAIEEAAMHLASIPDKWEGLTLEKRRQFIKLITDGIILEQPAPGWLQLSISWAWWDTTPGPDICLIWQITGGFWTQDERARLAGMYRSAPRSQILEAFPSRSWQAICVRAQRDGLTRRLIHNDTVLPPCMSVTDADFMRHAGIVFDATQPDGRVWWVTAASYNKAALSEHSARGQMSAHNRADVAR